MSKPMAREPTQEDLDKTGFDMMPGQTPWERPKKALRAAPGTRPEDHLWELAGVKPDHEAKTTYLCWGCRKCGRRVVTETATEDGEHTADQRPPDQHDLRRGNVDENCLQAMVDGVTRR